MYTWKGVNTICAVQQFGLEYSGSIECMFYINAVRVIDQSF